MTHNCRSCKKDKPEAEMHHYGNGQVGRTCTDCRAKEGKSAGGGSVKKAKKAKPPREKLKSESLVMPAAWGIEAHLEDGFLQLQQSDAEGNVDNLMLSRSELLAIIDKFGAWAHE